MATQPGCKHLLTWSALGGGVPGGLCAGAALVVGQAGPAQERCTTGFFIADSVMPWLHFAGKQAMMTG